MKEVDYIIFDIDGVLIDTSRSFPMAILSTMQMAIIGYKEEYTSFYQKFLTFKQFGGFNNDWELGLGYFYYLLFDRETKISLSEFLTASSKLGSGIIGIRRYVIEQGKAHLLNRLQEETLVMTMKWLYAGSKNCKRVYGFEAILPQCSGYYREENVLIDSTFLRDHFAHFRILTGRNYGEYLLAAELLGVKFPSDWVQYDDGRLPNKPYPQKIMELISANKTASYLYVGDSYDDFLTVKNTRQANPEVQLEFVQVLTDTAQPFSGVKYFVSNVNEVFKQFKLRSK